jgi:predicted RNase H-like nuclease (RuvC/YqgF family)
MGQEMRDPQERKAELEHQPGEREECIKRLESGLRDREQRVSDLERHLLARQERIDDLEHYLHGRQQRIRELEGRHAADVSGLEDLRAQCDVLRDSLDAVYASSSWRLTAPVRGIIAGMKPSHRLGLRRLAKLCYWIITPHLMFKRWKFLKDRKRQVSGEGSVSSAGSSHS